jgi:hypothetical protein
MSEGPYELPRYVNCPCRYCSKHIEFDASDFREDETRQVECPHCNLETAIFIPKTSLMRNEIFARIEPPPILPIWFGDESSVIEIRLTSGAILKIKDVGLYNAGELNDIAAQKAQAVELLNGVSSPYAAWGSISWVVFATTITNMIEKSLSRESAQRGIALVQKLAERERKLRENITFFPVGQIQEIENPVPGLWRVPSKSGFVHSGDEFIKIADIDGGVRSIRWSCVESYDYQANK